MGRSVNFSPLLFPDPAGPAGSDDHLEPEVRASYRLTVNNSDKTAFIDRLRTEHPQLRQLIGVRARGTPGPNKTKPVERTFTVKDLRLAYEMGITHGGSQSAAGVA